MFRLFFYTIQNMVRDMTRIIVIMLMLVIPDISGANEGAIDINKPIELIGVNCNVLNLAREQNRIVGKQMARWQAGEISQAELTRTTNKSVEVNNGMAADMAATCVKMILHRESLMENPTIPLPPVNMQLVEELESVWHSYVDAIGAGNAAKLKEAMSSAFYAEVKNNYASAKIELNEQHIKNMWVPELGKFSFSQLFHNGPTSGLLYSAVSSDDPDEVELMFIKFVQENAVWRIGAMVISHQQKLEAGGSPNVFTPESLSDSKFLIDGIVPQAQQLVSISADSRTGWLDIRSFAYSTTVSVNKGEPVIVENAQSAKRIILEAGNNEIEIVFAPLENLEPNNGMVPQVSILMRNKEGVMEHV